MTAITRSHQTPYIRLERVIASVGISHLEGFNLWAFRQHPIAYNDNLVFLWQNVHSTKGVDGEPDKVLETICQLWQEMNREWPDTYFGD